MQAARFFYCQNGFLYEFDSVPDLTGLRVAVIHDWLTGMRGGEKVLEAILDLCPGADLYTLIHNPGTVSQKITQRPLFTSFIDSLPFKRKFYRHYLPLFPAAIERFDLKGYDLIVSSSHCVARGIIPGPATPHVSFVHSPMRYVWDMYSEYFPEKGLKGFIIPFFANYLRMWDVSVSPRVDRYVANSRFVAARIKRYYGREATVIHPPCIEKISPLPRRPREDFYLIVSALVPYKRIDLALAAFQENGKKLIVCGSGPEEKKLRRQAGKNTLFRGSLPWAEIEDLLQRCRGLVFPGLEDFGIVPVEAQAQGCPVIGFGKGGLLETVVEGRTGTFFREQTVSSLQQAIEKHERIGYREKDFQNQARRFTVDRFKQAFGKEIERALSL